MGFFRKVGIIGGAVTVVLALAGGATAFAWRVATAPILAAIERVQDQSNSADAKITFELSRIGTRQLENRAMILLLGEANRYEPGDPRRSAKLDELLRIATGQVRLGLRDSIQ